MIATVQIGVQIGKSRAPTDAALRRVALGRQGLAGRRRLGAGLDGVEKVLNRLGYVQIDTISVVARAHHHTLFTRVSKYRESMLNRVVAKRRAFEYWCHAASYLPIREYRFALPMMRAVARGEVRFGRRRDEKMQAWVRDRIRAEGPLFARDFEDPRARRSGWWDWKPAKLALEQLFMQGELTSVERQGFQKRYELTERFLPADVETSEPTMTEHADYVIDVGLAAHGFGTEKTLAYFRRDARVRKAVRQRIAERVKSGDLVERRTRSGERIYARPGALDRAPPRVADVVRILSPFDSAVIQRKRGRSVFDFDYTIECYLPEGKREFGYFALPLVYGDGFVGRMDCKAHRAQGRFEIKALFVEATVPDAFMPAFAEAVRDYAAFTGCPEVEVGKVVPAGLRGEFQRLFRR